MATEATAGGGGGVPWWREGGGGVVAAVIAATAAGGYVAYRHYADPLDPRYARAVRQLADDPASLPADRFDRVRLAGGPYAGLTPRDELFVVRRPDGAYLVLFPTYYGSGTAMAGLMYTSRPLGDGDTYILQSALGKAHTVIDLGSYFHTDLDKRLDEHWYRVSYNMR